jgi:hypothetical protein
MRAPEPPYPSFSLALQKIVEPHENWSIAPSSAEDHRQRLFRKDHDDHLMVRSSTFTITLKFIVIFWGSKRTVYYTYQDDLEQPPIYHGYHVCLELPYNPIVIELSEQV